MSEDLDRRLLEAIEQNPDTTQTTLAAQLGVAVGSVNWYLKRLIRKGYVKVTHLQRRKLKYFVTPQGLAIKAHLTSQYMDTSLRVYRSLRQESRQILNEIRGAGYDAVTLDGDSEALEIFRLTCLEQGIQALTQADDAIPAVHAHGTSLSIQWPDQEQTKGS